MPHIMRLLFAGALLALAFGSGAGAEQPVGDLNGDWEVNHKDLYLLADQWLASGANSANFDGLGRVDMADFASLAGDWLDGSYAVVISEIHCNPDLETELVEFVELHNAGTRDVNISGWTLDDGISYTFEPNTILAAGTHIIVAENRDHIRIKWGGRGDMLRDVTFDPYTGNLDNDGERIRLRNTARETIDQVDYQLGFPWPTVGGSVPADTDGTGHSMQLMNPRLDNDLGGSWRSAAPTPAAANIGIAADNIPPQMRQVAHSPEEPISGQPTTITVKATDSNGVASIDLEYQVVLAGQYIPAYLPVAISVLEYYPDTEPASNPDYFEPANWTRITMRDDGTNGDATAGDDTYTAVIPAQPHRTIVRYRITAEDTLGMAVTGPYPDDPSLNFAYYVYDGVPGYEGYSAEMLQLLPVYHLITRNEDMHQVLGYDSADQIPKMSGANRNPARSVYNWRATFVYDGTVHDHIRYRLRGGNGRYLGGSTKRSMRFRFNRGSYLKARDAYGERYSTKWRTLTIAKGIDNRSTLTFSLNEYINSYLFNKVGVPAPYAHYFHFRVVDAAEEAPDKWRGDFWGLFFAQETYDVRFIDAHDLAKGNLYKLIDAVRDPIEQQRYQAAYAVTNGTDFDNIEDDLTGYSSVDFITNHIRLDKWYAYHSLCQAVRHYDF